LGLSLALGLMIGPAAAKEGGKGGARAKKARGDAKNKDRRNKAGQDARQRRRKALAERQTKAIEAIVKDLTAELDLTDDQKVTAEKIVKKHILKLTGPKRRGANRDRPKGQRPGKRNKARGGKKGQGPGKKGDGVEVDRF